MPSFLAYSGPEIVMKPDVLSLGAFPDRTNSDLTAHFAIHHFSQVATAMTSLNRDMSNRIRGLATEANRGASRALMTMLPKLEIISCFGVGVDAIDLAAARERNIAVTNTPGILADEVADLAIGLMLASARQIVIADRFVREGHWRAGPIGLGRSVTNKTMGIVGLGAIGRAIADRASALKMRVMYFGPRRKADAPYEFVHDLVELARGSDFLMIACKGGRETQHLVSADVIAALGEKGTLINVARGSVVDEPAMIAALAEGRLGFAALDVFANSPNIDAALLKLPNVIVQPHHGSATIETRQAMGQLVIDNLVAHFEGRPLLTPVA